MYIPKIIKILAPLVIIISIVLNPLSGGFNITASATVEDIPFSWLFPFLWNIGSCLSQIIDSCGSEITSTFGHMVNAKVIGLQSKVLQIQNTLKNAQEDINLSPFTTNQTIVKNEDGTWSYIPSSVSPNPEVVNFYSEEDKTLINNICNYINSYISENGADSTMFEKTSYGQWVTKLGLEAEMREFFTNKILAEAYTEWQNSLGNAVEATNVPQFNYNMLGAPSSVVMPMLKGMGNYVSNGYWFSRRIPSTAVDGEGFFTNAQTAEIYCDSYQLHKNGPDGNPIQFRGYINYPECNGYGTYIEYNSEVFYHSPLLYVEGKQETSGSYFIRVFPDIFGLYVNAQGEKLVDKGITASSFFYFGFVANVGNNSTAVPTYSVELSDEDFETVTGGETIEFPRSDEEEAIATALGLGLINPDSPVTLDNEGNIESIDGLTLAKLSEIAELIKSGNLNFEDVQQYLDLITQLLGTANINTSTQSIILENIAELTETQTTTIAEIKEMLENVDIDDEALTNSIEPYEITATFSGFPEAQELIATAFPIVKQSEVILKNLFDWDSDFNTPPNFQFYWDSNKDGEVETYTFFDLSFMETKLNNSNLVDKNRFVSPMTIREFLQSLIVLILYALFAINILRKLPGLFSSAESAGNTGSKLM